MRDFSTWALASTLGAAGLACGGKAVIDGDGAEPVYAESEYEIGRAQIALTHRDTQDQVDIAMLPDDGESEAIVLGDCALRIHGDPPKPPPPFASVGTVTIELAGGAIVLAPDAHDGWASETVAPALHAWGEPLRVAAEGAEIPAFDVNLAPIERLRITVPAPDESGFIHLGDEPFTVTWMAVEGAGEVVFIVRTWAPGPLDNTATLLCHAPSTAGTLTLAPSLVAQLDPGDATIFITMQRQATVRGNAWPVRIVLAGYAEDEATGYETSYSDVVVD